MIYTELSPQEEIAHQHGIIREFEIKHRGSVETAVMNRHLAQVYRTKQRKAEAKDRKLWQDRANAAEAAATKSDIDAEDLAVALPLLRERLDALELLDPSDEDAVETLALIDLDAPEPEDDAADAAVEDATRLLADASESHASAKSSRAKVRELALV